MIVLDEFPYLVEKDDAIPSLFQQAIDEVLKNKNIMLIICGSSISMMEELLGYKNPLYGRKTGHIKINHFKFEHFKKFFPENTLEEIIKTYSILGVFRFISRSLMQKNLRSRMQRIRFYQREECSMRKLISY
ncbi:MAG: ATP-binding protein [Euryarchaeota archaeon]|nr:ATP-binding protein [Euryarchaeota archaeon]